MRSEWSEVQISEVCELIVDCVNKTAPKVDEVTPFKMIRTTNVRHGRVDTSDCKYVTEEVFEKWTRRAKVLPKDVLLTREAPIGEVGMIRQNENLFLGQRIMQYRADRTKLIPEFLLYSFQSNYMQHQIRMHEGSGSVVSHIRVPDCLKFNIKLPPLPEQKAIAHILGTLDDKIELNRQMNETLEEMAQALFKSWFVDFDPVIDKALAAGHDIPEPLQQKAEKRKSVPEEQKLIRTNPQFGDSHEPVEWPDSFTFTEELGWIPEGWEVTEIRELVSKVSKGTTPRKNEIIDLDEVIPFLKARDISDDGTISSELDMIPEEVHLSSLKRSILESGDLLITIAGTIGRIAQLPVSLNNSNCNQAIAFIRLKDKSQYNNLVLFTLKSDFTFRFISEKIVQAVQANISLETVNSILVCIPEYHILKHWNALSDPIMDRIRANKEENSVLSSLRDTILPKLISGELRVPEAAQIIADHV
ncbi:MAG: hypothetical protein CMB80_21385 [Flammeovirgaceae bacterium]|nr:hypothetical protein [Flammeovirgaceae bacterium]|tara:strand:- start:3055 stop:4476 length:1422 start_codon:yes stop_codon:yes gene_type:complete